MVEVSRRSGFVVFTCADDMSSAAIRPEPPRDEVGRPAMEVEWMSDVCLHVVDVEMPTIDILKGHVGEK